MPSSGTAWRCAYVLGENRGARLSPVNMGNGGVVGGLARRMTRRRPVFTVSRAVNERGDKSTSGSGL